MNSDLPNFELLFDDPEIAQKEILDYFFEKDSVFIFAVNQVISSNRSNDLKYKALRRLAQIIFVQLGSKRWGDPYTFVPTELQNKFQMYMFSWDFLHRKRISFEEWADIAEEGFNLLKVLMEEKKLEKYDTDSRYHGFKHKYYTRFKELKQMEKYQHLNELLDV